MLYCPPYSVVPIASVIICTFLLVIFSIRIPLVFLEARQIEIMIFFWRWK
uniref:Uncharacterized protein n=1 Tax=Arundo donax TaxID=35708 RepID=A0A0A9BVK8_ARUDO